MPPIAGRPAQRAAVVGLALGALLAGCGSSSPAATDEPAARPALSAGGLVGAGPGAITVEAGSAVPLGIRPAQVIRRLGPPAVPLRAKGAHARCMLYDLIGQPPTVRLQYCFAAGKLDVVASYIADSSGR